MPNIQEQYIDARPEADVTWRIRLGAFGRWLFKLPGFRLFFPLARRLFSVTEPVGRLFIRNVPPLEEIQISSQLTILSANLWHDWPRHRQFMARLEAFAELVESCQADILLLQEVPRTPDIKADQWLLDRLSMAGVYCRANGHERGIGFEEGLAVLSRFPIREPNLRQLDTHKNPFVRRLALGAKIDVPWGGLLAFSVHLGLPPPLNAAQMTHLRQWITEITNDVPALIGGDFNAPETSARISQMQSLWVDTFRHIHQGGKGSTHELRWPWGGILRQSRLDYIFLKSGESSWQVVDACHLVAPGVPQSDHKVVMARLELPNAKGAEPV